jgi:hypothetical protein
MAKHKQAATLFPSPVAVLPEGYYSGDKPNPNLRAFVDARLRGRPYDGATDKGPAARRQRGRTLAGDTREANKGQRTRDKGQPTMITPGWSDPVAGRVLHPF